MECHTWCNKAFFPEIACVESPITFQYGGNKYTHLYEFRRPDPRLGQQGSDRYDQCKGFIAQNADYETIPHLGR